jgi:hypothetical protein
MVSQLLQRTPPAVLTAEQEAQLLHCYDVISQLADALQGAPPFRMQLVDAMLKQQAACSIGRLVTWVQQQPEQQQLHVRAMAGSAPVTSAAGSTTAPIWAFGVILLEHFAASAVLHMTDSAGSCNLAANLTQQLDQSGEACNR